MLEKAKTAAVTAAALLLAAMPAFGASNFALVKDNNVTATAVSGNNTQKQYNENELEAEVEGRYGGRAKVVGGNSGQYMFTGNSYAGAEQTIVANVDACCNECNDCRDGCGECDRCGCEGWNKAIIKYNDVTATAVSGENYQKQKNENELEAEVEGSRWGRWHHGSASASVNGGNSEQVMQTGDSQAWAAQWIVVNSSGSF